MPVVSIITDGRLVMGAHSFSSFLPAGFRSCSRRALPVELVRPRSIGPLIIGIAQGFPRNHICRGEETNRALGR